MVLSSLLLSLLPRQAQARWRNIRCSESLGQASRLQLAHTPVGLAQPWPRRLFATIWLSLLAACGESEKCSTEVIPITFEVAVPGDDYRALVGESSEFTLATCRSLCRLGDEAVDCTVLSDLGDSGKSDSGEGSADFALVECTRWWEPACT